MPRSYTPRAKKPSSAPRHRCRRPRATMPRPSSEGGARARETVALWDQDGPDGRLVAGMREAWLEADRLGFDTAWGHDHLLNQDDIAPPEDEGWTDPHRAPRPVRRIRGGLMVTANTFRHPSLLAKIGDDGRSDLERAGRGRARRRAGWRRSTAVRHGPAARRRAACGGSRKPAAHEAALDPSSDDLRGRLLPGPRGLPRAEADPAPPPADRDRRQRREGDPEDRGPARRRVEHVEGTPDEFRKKCAILDEHCRDVGRDPSDDRALDPAPGRQHEGDVGARPRVHRGRRHPPDLQLSHALQRRGRARHMGGRRPQAPRWSCFGRSLCAERRALEPVTRDWGGDRTR